jgi:hypothetical protein
MVGGDPLFLEAAVRPPFAPPSVEAAAIRLQLMLHGDSRFQHYGVVESATGGYRITNRLGFKMRNTEGETEYQLPRESLAEICKPYQVDFAVSTLRKCKLLELEKAAEQKHDYTVRREPPGMPRGRYYVITSRIFQEEQSSFGFAKQSEVFATQSEFSQNSQKDPSNPSKGPNYKQIQ